VIYGWWPATIPAPPGCAELTGRPVGGAAVQMYRMRWSLDDTALAVRDFRAPHEQNEDSGLTWETLTEEIGAIA
jgi:spectinomycin phosphotransferase